MIVLPTGFGKTVLSVSLICKLGVKTMIIAHKDFLLD
jgi:superfamily II DNA or RNA helicase